MSTPEPESKNISERTEADNFLFSTVEHSPVFLAALDAVQNLPSPDEKRRALQAVQKLIPGVVAEGEFYYRSQTTSDTQGGKSAVEKQLEALAVRLGKSVYGLSPDEKMSVYLSYVPQPVKGYLEAFLRQDPNAMNLAEILPVAGVFKTSVEKATFKKSEPAIGQVKRAIQELEIKLGVNDVVVSTSGELGTLGDMVELLPDNWHKALYSYDWKKLANPLGRRGEQDKNVATLLYHLTQKKLIEPLWQPENTLLESLNRIVKAKDFHPKLMTWPYVQKTLEWSKEAVATAIPDKRIAQILNLGIDGITAAGKAAENSFAFRGKQSPFGLIEPYLSYDEKIEWGKTLAELFKELSSFSQGDKKQIAVKVYTPNVVRSDTSIRYQTGNFAKLTIDLAQQNPVIEITGLNLEVVSGVPSYSQFGVRSTKATAWVLQQIAGSYATVEHGIDNKPHGKFGKVRARLK
ncbi:hypothetical protein HYS11_00485 [Candidatus Gottesmanbacteria bacterium]|nr:hypothetical protein [Candidatus Gottesmanbacteria bacterium]MBI3443709.1 hypothetical protein [Candidatus Woesebacteria bacterium]